jgi:membrane fusion protein (multidrug efflux system)
MTRWAVAAFAMVILGPGLARAEDPAIPAQIVAAQFTVLSAEIPAKIDRIAVKEGERFKVGQTLVSFDCAVQRAQLEEARAVLAGAERAREVHKRLQALNSTGLLEADKAQSDAAVAQAKAESAKAVIAKCAIAAPFSGRVVEQKARAHQYVQAGQAILEVLDDSLLEAEFILPSAWIGGLKAGHKLQVTVDETRKTYPARVTRMGAKVDAVSHSVKVVAEITGEHPDLMAGMSGRVLVDGR